MCSWKEVCYAVRLAKMHLFTQLQTTRRIQGPCVRHGRGFIQVALPTEKEIVSYQRPIVVSRLYWNVSE